MRLKAPKGIGAVSFNGQSYPVEKGFVTVPDEAQVFLEPGYGFEQAPAEPEPDKKAGKTEA